jgi:PAS domain S-box-containing protein
MKTKILIIEHDSNDMELIQDELKKGNVNFITEIVETKKEYTHALHTFRPDIILSNCTFPAFDGLTALRIREELVPQTPFIFVSESIDPENTEGIIKNGVTDFVLKKRLHTLIDKMNLALKVAELNKINTLLQQSEEKRTEELFRNESKYQSLVESSMDAILLTVKDGRILTANATACGIFKMTNDEICNSTRLDIVDCTDPRLRLLLEERERTGRAKGELTFIRKDGSKFPGEITSVVFTDACGQEKTSMTIRDMTERKQAEQALKASESFSKGILDSLTSHIAVINSEGTIVKVNKSWNTFADNNGGNSAEKYGEGANYFDACNSQNNSTDDPDSRALKGIKDVLTGIKNEFYLEYPCHSPRTERWFNMRVNILDSPETMVLIEHHDISERKLAEQKLSITTNALQQALNDLNKILDSSLDVICSIDKKGKFVSVNAASERIWGYSPNELIGKNYIDFVFHEDIEKTHKTVATIKSGAPVTIFENRYIHKNGRIVPILWSSRWDKKDRLFYNSAKDATEKKNLEKAFDIERQRFMDLYSQAPSSMGILKGPKHIYEMANPLYLQLIDKKKDIIGKTVKEVLPELEAQGIFEFLDTVYQTGETFSANELLMKFDRHGNGKLVDSYLNLIYQAHRDVDGNIDGILFFVNDVTEQVISRKKIEQSEKRYWELIENLPVATYSCDADGRIMIYNKAAAELWGLETEIDKDLWYGSWNIYSLDNNPIPIELCPMAVALKEGKAVIGEEIIIKRPNGEKRYVIPHPVPFIDNEGRITGAVNVLADITENKQTQQTLKENEKKYRYLFDNNPMPMWIIDEITSKFLDVNEMAILQYGYSRKEFLSMSAIDIRPEEDKERFRQLDNSTEINGTKFNRGIWNHIKKDGTVIPVEIIAQKIIYEGIMAQFILSNDITDRRKAELNLEQQNKELIKTNAELDRFVYSVSHDLRSPLTSILGLLSFIEEESQEADTLEHADMIHKSINRLDEFIKNILSYSRNNRTGLEIEKISIQETALAIVDSLQSMKEAKEIHYEIDIQEHEPFFSDALRFNTIMENLISNAIKHHRKRKFGRYIKITGQSDHEKLEFSVTDNGIGIAPENHQKIFDMFFRLSGETDGSGIGLYIVRDAVEKMQGTLEIRSEKEIGTTFIIKLKNLKR